MFFKSMRASLLVIVGSLLVLTSCSEYQKVLSSDDSSKKYAVADSLYKVGKYRKALKLMEQIVPAYRGKPQAQRLMFIYANTFYELEDYYLAGYQFERFEQSYPSSDSVEVAAYRSARSFYELSPRYSLDQEDTYIAIEKLQVFMNNYPNSKFSKEANSLINELQIKLEKKDFEISKQYYTIRDYKPSIKENNNFISSFPGTKFREESMYVTFNSMYEIAINSIELKKRERLNELKDYIKLILDYYPETTFIVDLEKKTKIINKELNFFKDKQLPTK